uniref:F-box domain-containing protein n=1 Tax=Plectus sambesii TaxID=2011161 RepID=A0A914V055_9BILA
MARCALLREECQQVALLPPEMIESIVDWMSPLALAESRWELVSKGFHQLMRGVYRRKTMLCSMKGPDAAFFRQFVDGECSDQQYRRLLRLVQAVFPNIVHLQLEAGVFCALLQVLNKMTFPSTSPLMPKLQKLSLLLGAPHGRLSLNTPLENFCLARRLASDLQSVAITVNVRDDSTDCTSCDLRRIARWLVELNGRTSSWDVDLRDWTANAQGWFSPSDVTALRDRSFIGLVRALMDVGAPIGSLALHDCLRQSPYMLIMTRKQRALYMYDEFKMVQNLVIGYDIGIVAPAFAHLETFGKLQHVRLEYCHVLFKPDFVTYLQNAPNLETVTVVLPHNWEERVARCTEGCFRNADYFCFKPEGWPVFHRLLPSARLEFEHYPDHQFVGAH